MTNQLRPIKCQTQSIKKSYSGGDHVGDRSYPGLSLYHEGIDLVAIVSTGEDVWHLKVTGQLINETWSNIGIRLVPRILRMLRIRGING